MSEASSTTVATNVEGEVQIAMSPDDEAFTVSTSTGLTTTDPSSQKNDPAHEHQTSQNEENLINEMKSFDNLLKMLSVYRDNPDLRGNPNDRNIEEIAKVLSNFIGDDPDNFLKDSDEEEGEDKNGDQIVDSKKETPPINTNDNSDQS